MPHRPTFSTLWAINGPLDAVELRSQLRDFVRAGLDGVVFHPRFYPGEPAYLSDEYLRIVSDLILEARDLGLAFWIYDEDGWPSGTVGGRMLEAHPDLRQRWVELQPDTGQAAVRRFVQDDRAWAVVERVGEGVDYLSTDLAPRFIELCYARYAHGIAPEALAHVAGFFSDEPEFGLGHAQHELAPGGALPWTPDLADRYAERYGAELLDDLPSVFLTDARSASVRARFWELVTDLFAERYLGVLDRWCRDRGLRFTAHMKGEEHPLFQLPTLGALGSISRAIGTPGVDALGRHPINDFFPRQVSSVARQFGDGRAMAEAFGGAGWGASPADLAGYLRWLGGHGITDFMLHISQYRLDTAAIEDWPPSHPRHVSWSELYADVLDEVRADLAAPRPVADVLVVVPQRGIAERFEPWEFVATNVHDAHDFPDTPAGRVNAEFLALVQRLHAAGVAYEFADERTLEHAGRFEDGGLVLGDARYRRVIVPADARLDPEVAARLATLQMSEGDGCLASASSLEAPPSAAHSVPVSWRLAARPVNELVLRPERSTDDRVWVATATSHDYGGPVEVRFADEPASATWDGVTLEVRSSADLGFVATAELAPGAPAELRFSTAGRLQPGASPRVWIAGGFSVHASLADDVVRGHRADDALIAVAEPFRLGVPDGASGAPIPPDLSLAGYPFVFEPIEAVAQLELPAGAEAVTLIGGVGDAARLQLGDGQAVWRWSPGGWSIPVGKNGGGSVELRVRLVPNSFNRYGPHHHYLGDPPVVSPAQMRGERNYADADDAPAATHVAHWWVRRLALPSSVEITVPESALAEEASALVDNQVTRS